MKLRIARSTSKLKLITEMYRAGLGLSILGSFENHAGFSGVMLGDPKNEYHFEFTEEENADSQSIPHKESLIVFYEPEPIRYVARIQDMKSAGFKNVKSHNPYWDDVGETFVDLDGHRIVICKKEWKT